LAYYLFNFTKKAAKSGVPLREQAAQLLEHRLWGIGAKTPNRDRLAEGDRVLAYVGAPEQCFVGSGTLAGGVHDWSPAEARSYPGEWTAGVALSEATVWEEPVPLAAVWSGMPSSASNPNARFFSGVVQIKQRDYEVALATASGAEAPAAATDAPPAAAIAPSSRVLDSLYATVEKLRLVLAADSPMKLTEEATRAMFIDPTLQALGYTELGDVDYGVTVESKDVADYVLNVDGAPAIVVEAKRLDTKLGAEHAAQVIKYASVIGVRWGLLTNGRVFQLFDRIPNLSPLERRVFEVDLIDCTDREDFEVKLFPDLSLLVKSAMADGSGLDRRAAQKAARDLLTSPESLSVTTLRAELADSQLAHLTNRELAELLAELL
jgi:hypothetical protein